MSRDAELHAQASLGAHLRGEIDKWHAARGNTLTFRTHTFHTSHDLRNAHEEEELIKEIVPRLPGLAPNEARAFLRTMSSKNLRIMAAQLRPSLRVNPRLGIHDRDMAPGSTFVANTSLARDQNTDSGCRTLRVNHDESGDAAAWRRRQEQAEALQRRVARDHASGNAIDAMTPPSSFVVNENAAKRRGR